MVIDANKIISEVTYRTSRSSGSGGQHVNKVESRVEAILNIRDCTFLTDAQKQMILSRLKNRVDKAGNLTVASSTSRQQKQNRRLATERLINLLTLALRKKKIRKKLGIPKSEKENRLKKKKQRSEIKSSRSFNPDI